MRIKPTTIKITEEPGSGIVSIDVEVEHKDGSSRTHSQVGVYAVGKKLHAVTRAIGRILDDYKKDGTLEE